MLSRPANARRPLAACELVEGLQHETFPVLPHWLLSTSLAVRAETAMAKVKIAAKVYILMAGLFDFCLKSESCRVVDEVIGLEGLLFDDEECSDRACCCRALYLLLLIQRLSFFHRHLYDLHRLGQGDGVVCSPVTYAISQRTVLDTS